MRKRLCRQASPETRAYAEDFKAALHDCEPELADTLVPNCVYRCGCPETKTCGWWDRMLQKTGGSPGLHPHRRALRALQPPLPGGPEK